MGVIATLFLGLAVGATVAAIAIGCGNVKRLRSYRIRIVELRERTRRLQGEAIHLRELLSSGVVAGTQIDEKRLLLHELRLRLSGAESRPRAF